MAKIPNGGGASAVKVKLMCSYGGRIQPRLQDHHLSYVGGDSKILTVNRNITLPDIVDKLQSLCSFKGDAICIKYQLPGDDLDVLISLINEDDLENMMIEYDRLQAKVTPEKPVRFRLFLASVNTYDDDDDASQLQVLDSVKDAAVNPDYLFGLDKSISDLSPSAFDLGLWSIPKAAIAAAGNTCSVTVNLSNSENENQDSRESHVPAALVYNLQIPGRNCGFQTVNGVGRMVVPVHSVNGYSEQPIYFMAAQASGYSAPVPEQKKIMAAPSPLSGCMVCGDGNVVNNNN